MGTDREVLRDRRENTSMRRLECLARYVVLENVGVNWVWDEHDVLKFQELWQQGYSICSIAEHFGVEPIDIFLLALDRAEQGFICKRDGGIWGNENS